MQVEEDFSKGWKGRQFRGRVFRRFSDRGSFTELRSGRIRISICGAHESLWKMVELVSAPEIGGRGVQRLMEACQARKCVISSLWIASREQTRLSLLPGNGNHRSRSNIERLVNFSTKGCYIPFAQIMWVILLFSWKVQKLGSSMET